MESSCTVYMGGDNSKSNARDSTSGGGGVTISDTKTKPPGGSRPVK